MKKTGALLALPLSVVAFLVLLRIGRVPESPLPADDRAAERQDSVTPLEHVSDVPSPSTIVTKASTASAPAGNPAASSSRFSETRANYTTQKIAATISHSLRQTSLTSDGLAETNAPETRPPTLPEMNQVLALPLAVIGRDAAPSIITPEQSNDLASIANEFNNNVAAASQATASPVTPTNAGAPANSGDAARFQTAQELADEEVWAVDGQDAYTALVNERSQVAGNVAPAPSPR